MRTSRTLWGFIPSAAALAVLAVGAAACGGDDGGGAAETRVGTTVAASAATAIGSTTAPMPAGNDDAASRTPDLATDGTTGNLPGSVEAARVAAISNLTAVIAADEGGSGLCPFAGLFDLLSPLGVSTVALDGGAIEFDLNVDSDLSGGVDISCESRNGSLGVGTVTSAEFDSAVAAEAIGVVDSVYGPVHMLPAAPFYDDPDGVVVQFAILRLDGMYAAIGAPPASDQAFVDAFVAVTPSLLTAAAWLSEKDIARVPDDNFID